MERKEINEPTSTSQQGNVAHDVRTWLRRWSICLLSGLTAGMFYLMGSFVQQLDPTAGWLDIGTLSLPLFAAWSCLLGVTIAGLLPPIMDTIGKKGGIKRWKADKTLLWQVIIYLGYIALLCVLL